MRLEDPPAREAVAAATVWRAAAEAPAISRLMAGGLPSALAALLARRGIESTEQARAFLEPASDQLHDPLLLAGVREAVERLLDARDGGHRVAIVGDYDVDGVSGTALLTVTLRACGIEVVPILPHRMRDGYGFQDQHVERAEEEGCRLIVTVDCGTTSGPTVQRALQRDIDVIVTDHHLPGDDFPPQAVQINPRQATCDYPFADLAAVGLALKLAIALLQRCGKKVPLAALLRVACLGTIADVVPLVGENRVIAALGLRALGAARSPGLRALMEVSGVKPPLRADDVGFRLGPRINAAGRLDSAERALELLLTTDPGEAQRLAQQLDGWNQRRKDAEQKVVDEAFGIFDALPSLPALLVAWSPDWHRGVVGIAAGRLARHYHRPTVLLAMEGEHSTGSGRSIEGVHLFDFLNRLRGDLLRFGGHAQAVGLTAESGRLEQLRERWLEAADWPPEVLARQYTYDLRLESAGEFSRDLYQELVRLEPFGAGNSPPLLRLGPLRLTGPPRLFGNGHLKAQAESPDGERVALLGWRWAERSGSLKERFEVIGYADWDDYLAAPVVRLVDARPAS